MTPQQHLEAFIERYTYTPDPNGGEHWARPVLSGPVRDDCEGFAMSLLAQLAGSEAAMWEWLEGKRAKLIHVENSKGDGHVVLWVKDMGYVDSALKFWRDRLGFPSREFDYTPNMIRRKLAGKKVRGPTNKKMLALALLVGAGTLFFAFGM